MAKKLYVGNVAWATTNDSLKEAFSQAGPVESASIIMDKFTGRSRGYGFVEMTNDEDAQKAVALWNGKDLDGRQLRVSEALPQEDKPKRDFGDRPRRDFGGGSGGGRKFGGQRSNDDDMA